MGSGPRAGIGELFLPELQKGSSIMPGKVNPVIPEVVLQVACQVIGNDMAITMAGSQGNFELNVRIPLIARNLLQSIHLLTTTSDALREKCVDGIEPNLEGCERSAEGDARRRDRAQPVHRLRPRGGDRQGGRVVGPHAARGRAREGRRRGDARQGARPAQDRRGLSRRARSRTASHTRAATSSTVAVAVDQHLAAAHGGEVVGPHALELGRRVDELVVADAAPRRPPAACRGTTVTSGSRRVAVRPRAASPRRPSPARLVGRATTRT